MKKIFVSVILLILTACATSPILLETSLAPLPSTKATRPTPTASPTILPTQTNIPSATPALIPTNPNVPEWPTGTPLPSLQSGLPVVLTRIDMLDDTSGWGVETNGHLLRTSDGGVTWQDVTPPETGYYATGDSLHAWDIVQSRVSCQLIGCSIDWAPGLVSWSTSDGGQSWQRGGFFLGGVPDFRPVAMQFIDPATGWFLFVDQVGMSGFTYQSLVRTLDGGASWTLIQPFNNGCISGGMIFLDEQNGWIGDDCRWITNTYDGIPLQDVINGKAAPSLNRTSDGGMTWEYSEPPPPVDFPPEFTATYTTEYISVYCGVGNMQRISQEAFLLQWNCRSGNPETPLDALYTYLTTDKGQTWHSWLSTGNENFLNATTGWRLVSPAGAQPGLLQQTTDGGATWQTIKTVAWQTAVFDFTSAQMGWALASDGTNTAFVHTGDGGKTWVEIKPMLETR